MNNNKATDHDRIHIMGSETETTDNTPNTLKPIPNTPQLDNENGNITSGDNLSVWFAAVTPLAFEN